MWDKMEKFLETDPSILSANHTKQVQRVAAGNYGYLSDVSAVTLLRSDLTCNVTNIAERFWPLHYAIGLQNNSAYQAVFDRQYVHA